MGLSSRIINAQQARAHAKGKKTLMERMAERTLDAAQPYKLDEVGTEAQKEEVMRQTSYKYVYTCRFFTDQMQLERYLNEWQIRPEDIVDIQMSVDRERPISEAPGRMMILLTYVQVQR